MVYSSLQVQISSLYSDVNGGANGAIRPWKPYLPISPLPRTVVPADPGKRLQKRQKDVNLVFDKTNLLHTVILLMLYINNL